MGRPNYVGRMQAAFLLPLVVMIGALFGVADALADWRANVWQRWGTPPRTP